MLFLQKLYNEIHSIVARYVKNNIGFLDIGIVSEVDPTTHSAKVIIQPGGYETNWCQVSERVASVNGAQDSNLPQAGDHVLVSYYKGSKQSPIIIGSVYNDSVGYPTAPNGELWKLHSTGSFIKFTNQGYVLINGNSQVNLTSATVNVTTTGNIVLTASGNATVIGTIITLGNNSTTQLKVGSLNAIPSVASPSNANAQAAGVPVGGFYRNTSDPCSLFIRSV